MERLFCAVVAVFFLGCGPAGLSPVDNDGTDVPPVQIGEVELVAVAIAPDDPVLGAGESIALSARAVYSDQSSEDATAEVAWAVTDDRVATISASGVLVAKQAGSTEVIAEYESHLYDSFTDVVHVVVVEGEATLDQLALSPGHVELRVGQSSGIAAQATWSDGTTGNVAGSCDWSVVGPGVASVDGSGTVTGVSEGTTSVAADCAGRRATATVAVAALEEDIGEPDLRITHLSADVLGDDVVYAVTVRNTGEALSGGFYVDLHLDAASAPDGSVVGDDWHWVSALAPDETRTITLTLVDVAPGTYASWAIADPEGYVAESDESDNVAGPVTVDIAAQLQGPNLVITELEALSDGWYTWYAYTIANQGDVEAVDFWVDLFYDVASQPGACAYGDAYHHVASLAPGASVDLEHEASDGPALWWDSWLVVDTCDDVEEHAEGDNAALFVVWPD